MSKSGSLRLAGAIKASVPRPGMNFPAKTPNDGAAAAAAAPNSEGGPPAASSCGPSAPFSWMSTHDPEVVEIFLTSLNSEECLSSLLRLTAKTGRLPDSRLWNLAQTLEYDSAALIESQAKGKGPLTDLRRAISNTGDAMGAMTGLVSRIESGITGLRGGSDALKAGGIFLILILICKVVHMATSGETEKSTIKQICKWLGILAIVGSTATLAALLIKNLSFGVDQKRSTGHVGSRFRDAVGERLLSVGFTKDCPLYKGTRPLASSSYYRAFTAWFLGPSDPDYVLAEAIALGRTPDNVKVEEFLQRRAAYYAGYLFNIKITEMDIPNFLLTPASTGLYTPDMCAYLGTAPLEYPALLARFITVTRHYYQGRTDYRASMSCGQGGVRSLVVDEEMDLQRAVAVTSLRPYEVCYYFDGATPAELAPVAGKHYRNYRANESHLGGHPVYGCFKNDRDAITRAKRSLGGYANSRRKAQEATQINFASPEARELEPMGDSNGDEDDALSDEFSIEDERDADEGADDNDVEAFDEITGQASDFASVIAVCICTLTQAMREGSTLTADTVGKVVSALPKVAAGVGVAGAATTAVLAAFPSALLVAMDNTLGFNLACKGFTDDDRVTLRNCTALCVRAEVDANECFHELHRAISFVNCYRYVTDDMKYDRDNKKEMVFKAVASRMKPFLSSAHSRMSTGETRPTPYVVYLWGPSGAGKSQLGESLLEAAFSRHDGPKSYSLNPTLNHWDGHAEGLPGVTVDDFRSGSQESRIEFNNRFIPMISNTKYVVPMAALHEKGQCMTAKVVVMTSNTAPEVIPAGLTTPEAFFNRLHCRVKATVRPAFQNDSGGLDIAAVMAQGLRDRAMYAHLKLEAVWQNDNKLWVRSTINFLEFVQLIKRGVARHQASYESVREANVEAVRMINEAHPEGQAGRMGVWAKKRPLPMPGAPVDSKAPSKKPQALRSRSQGPVGQSRKVPHVRQQRAELNAQKHARRRNAASDPAASAVPATPADLASLLNAPRDEKAPQPEEHDMSKWYFKKRFGIAFGVVVALATGFGLYGAATAFSKPEGEMYKKRSNKPFRKLRQRGLRIRRAGGQSGEAEPDLAAKLMDHVVHTSVGGVSAHICIIKGQVALAPSHLFKHVVDGVGKPIPDDSIVLLGPDKVQMRFGDMHCSPIYNEDGTCSDLSLVRVKALAAKRSIIGHFPNEAGLCAASYSQFVTLVTPDSLNQYGSGKLNNVGTTHWKSVPDLDDDDVYVSETYAYSGATEKGQCGQLVCNFGAKGNQVIRGIHLAGAKVAFRRKGLARYLSRETVQDLFDSYIEEHNFGAASIVPKPHPDVTYGQAKVLRGFEAIGKLDHPVGQADNHKIELSPIAAEHKWAKECPFEPVACSPKLAGLSPDDFRDTLMYKESFCATPFPCEVVNLAAVAVNSALRRLPGESPMRKLTWAECFNGCDDFPRLGPLSVSTSAGYPYCSIGTPEAGKLPGKNSLLHRPEGPTGPLVAYPSVLAHLDMIEADLRQGKLLDFVALEAYKAEVLKPGKQCRLIRHRGFDAQVIMRRYFGSFASYCNGSCGMGFLSVGMNMWGPDYDAWMKSNEEFSRSGTSFDFVNYDCIYNYQFISKAAANINSFYKEFDPQWCSADDAIREALLYSILHSKNTYGQGLYQARYGGLTGNMLTLLLNGIIGHMLIAIAYIMLAREHCPEQATLTAFRRNVKATHEGDDCVMFTKPFIQKWFNGENIAAFFQSFAVHATPSDKSASWKDHSVSPIDKLGYCSTLAVRNTFGIPATRWLAVPERNGIGKSTKYIKRGLPPEVACMQNVHGNQLRMLGFGPATYNDYYQESKRVFLKNGISTDELMTWDERVAHYLGDEPIEIWGQSGNSEGSAEMGAAGIHFVDPDVQTVSSTAAVGPRIEESASSNPLDLTSVLSRPYPIQTGDWVGADDNGKLLWEATAPGALLSPQHRQVISMFNFFRYKHMVIRIQVQANRFLSGALTVMAAPFVTAVEAPLLYFGADRRSSWGLIPNVKAFAGASTSAVLKVPFFSQDMWLRPNRFDGVAFTHTVIVGVHNVLKGVLPTATYTIYVSYEEPELRNFTRVPELPPLAFSGTPKAIMLAHRQALIEAYEEDEEYEDIRGQGNITSSVQNWNIDGSTIDNTTRTKGDFQGQVDASLDQPNVSQQGIPTLDRPVYITNGNGISTSEQLALTAGATFYPMAEDSGDPVDHSNMRTMLETPTLLETFTWSSANDPQDVIFETRLTPMTQAPTKTLNDIYSPNLFEYLCAPGAFFTGGIIYILEAVATSVHTGRVAAGIAYANNTAPTPGSNEAMTAYAQVLTVNAGTTQLEVYVPYQSHLPTLRVANGGANGTNRFSFGTFYVAVINKLQTMESIASEIEMNVYVKAAPDFQLHFHGAQNLTLEPNVLGLEQLTDIVGQAGSDNIDPDPDVSIDDAPTTSEVVPGAQPVSRSKMLFEDPIESMITTMKRGHLLWAGDITPESRSITIPVAAVISSVIGDNAPPGIKITEKARYAALFRAWSGGFKFDLIGSAGSYITYTTTSTSPQYVEQVFDNLDLGPTVGGPQSLQVRGLPQSVSTVYTSRFPWMQMPWLPADLSKRECTPGYVHIRLLGSTAEAGKRAYLFARVSDDFKLLVPVAIPRYHLAIRSQGPDTYPDQQGSTDVSEFYTVINGEGEAFLPGLRDLTTATAVVGNLREPVTSFTIASADLSDASLRQLGISITDGAPRNIIPGTEIVERNLLNIIVCPQTYNVVAELPQPRPPTGPFTNANFSLVNPSTGPGGEVLGSNAIFTTSSWDNELVLRQIWSLGNGRVGVVNPDITQSQLDVQLVTIRIGLDDYGLLSNEPETYIIIAA